MAFADDLLTQAYHLANMEGPLTQADLRRAVSTAYFALFHLLIDETISKWTIERHRSALGRTFEHKLMKAACKDHVKYFYSAGKPASGANLKNVAQTFIILQQARHVADYDVAFDWSRTNAIGQVDLAKFAFDDWNATRTDAGAQDFLLSLFLPRAADFLSPSNAGQDVV